MKNLSKILLAITCFVFLRCNAQNQQSNISEEESGGTTNHSGTASVKNINFLLEYTGNAAELNVEDKYRGGYFKLVSNAKLNNDYGMIFPAADDRINKHWVRETENNDSVNLKWYGAKGEGVAHYKEDSAALVNAIKFIESKGGGKLYIPASTSFYAYNGIGILLPDNIEIYGDGDRSEIKNINPEFAAGVYYLGVIFFTTTYGPNNFNGLTREPTYEVNNANRGQNFVVLKEAAKKWSPGDIIGLGSNYFFKKETDYKGRYSEFELNEITKINGDTIYLKYPLSITLKYIQPGQQPQINENRPAKNNNNPKQQKRAPKNPEMSALRNDSILSKHDNSGYPVIIDVNSKNTFNEKLKVYDRISRNIYIHNLKLSQSDYNMITNAPYKYETPPGDVIELGGSFESKFDHLTLEGAGTFAGNLWNRCEISNLTIYSQRKLFDLGYGSANTKLHDIKWIYKPTKIPENVDVSLVFLNDGTHHIELSNIDVSGAWSRSANIFQLAGGSHDINVHDLTINLPNYNAPNGRIISIRDDNEDVYEYNITFQNIDIKIGQAANVVRIDGVDVPGVQKNIKLSHITFAGAISNNSKNSITIENSSNLQLSDLNVPGGNIYLSNIGNGRVDNIKAPNSYIIFPATGQNANPNVQNSVYRGIKSE